MAELKQLEFFLLRYVPIAVRDEFVNIGLILMEASHAGFAEIRFTPDWRAAERLDPQIDIEMLQAIAHYAERQFQDPGTRELFLRKMADSFSNVIQLSPISACLTEDPAKEIEALASFYFKNIHQPSQRVPSGRNRIWQQMHSAFEQEGILGSLLTDIPMARYTRPGDSLKLDFAYASLEKLKIFQAVSLKGNLNQARYFGSRAAGIIATLADKTGIAPYLTAVVDDDLNTKDIEVSFALTSMTDSGVQLLSIADMPRVAHEARLELRL